MALRNKASYSLVACTAVNYQTSQLHNTVIWMRINTPHSSPPPPPPLAARKWHSPPGFHFSIMSKFYVFRIKSHASSRFSVNFPSFGTDNFCVKIIIFYRLSQCGSALPGWKQKLINVASPEIAYLYANPICLLTPNICTGVLLHTNRQWLGMILMGNNDHKLSRKHSTSNLIPRHGHGHFRFCGRVASQICHLWSSYFFWRHFKRLGSPVAEIFPKLGSIH